jgi:hypothetical protein
MAFVFSGSTVTPRGDGTFIVTPGKPMQRLTVTAAARELGCSIWTVYRLRDSGHLEAERPSPHKTLILAESIAKHRAAVRDPEFWEKAQAGQ